MLAGTLHLFETSDKASYFTHNFFCEEILLAFNTMFDNLGEMGTFQNLSGNPFSTPTCQKKAKGGMCGVQARDSSIVTKSHGKTFSGKHFKSESLLWLQTRPTGLG